MLRINQKEKRLEKLTPTELTTENILERYHLQKMIVDAWEIVKNEIGLPTAFLVGQEIRPHDSTQDAIDLLAYNHDDSSLVVIEIKRKRQKLQLLQALSYAAMLSNWDSEILLKNIQEDAGSDREELREIIADNEISKEIKIILIAESFDPEVIITADWLSREHGVDITAFSISPHKIEDHIILHFDQRFPLKELSDVYESRAHSRKKRISRDDITWENIIPKLKYSFAQRAVKLATAQSMGEPSRRRIRLPGQKVQGFTWISLNFRVNYINVYTGVEQNLGMEEIKRVFGNDIEILPWERGLSFHITTEEQFDRLQKWLKL